MTLMTTGESPMFMTRKQTLFGIVLLAWSITASGYVFDFKTRYKALSNFDYAPAIRVVEMLAKAIDQAQTTDPLKVAYALEGVRYQ